MEKKTGNSNGNGYRGIMENPMNMEHRKNASRVHIGAYRSIEGPCFDNHCLLWLLLLLWGARPRAQVWKDCVGHGGALLWTATGW